MDTKKIRLTLEVDKSKFKWIKEEIENTPSANILTQEEIDK